MIGFFVEVKDIEEAAALGSFSSEPDRWVAFKRSPIDGCNLYWCLWGC
jgi:hypothetical protein